MKKFNVLIMLEDKPVWINDLYCDQHSDAIQKAIKPYDGSAKYIEHKEFSYLAGHWIEVKHSQSRLKSILSILLRKVDSLNSGSEISIRYSEFGLQASFDNYTLIEDAKMVLVRSGYADFRENDDGTKSILKA